MNLYAYVGGDPVNAIDPEGLLVGDPSIYTTALSGAQKGSKFGPLGAAIGAAAAISAPVTLGDGTLEGKQCEGDPCSAYPARSVAFAQASYYAGLSSNWNKVGWDQYNYPRDKGSQISYTQLRQRIGNDPYGYRSPDGGEVVEHPADGDHPCPHFHAKKNLSGSSKRFPYDPNK